MYNETLLSSLLEHAGNSKNISHYLECEELYLEKNIVEGGSVIDFGCGYGRQLENTVSHGLGIDTSSDYVDFAKKNNKPNKIIYSGTSDSRYIYRAKAYCERRLFVFSSPFPLQQERARATKLKLFL